MRVIHGIDFWQVPLLWTYSIISHMIYLLNNSTNLSYQINIPFKIYSTCTSKGLKYGISELTKNAWPMALGSMRDNAFRFCNVNNITVAVLSLMIICPGDLFVSWIFVLTGSVHVLCLLPHCFHYITLECPG